jgi:hypothetical protein
MGKMKEEITVNEVEFNEDEELFDDEIFLLYLMRKKKRYYDHIPYITWARAMVFHKMKVPKRSHLRDAGLLQSQSLEDAFEAHLFDSASFRSFASSTLRTLPPGQYIP